MCACPIETAARTVAPVRAVIEVISFNTHMLRVCARHLHVRSIPPSPVCVSFGSWLCHGVMWHDRVCVCVCVCACVCVCVFIAGIGQEDEGSVYDRATVHQLFRAFDRNRDHRLARVGCTTLCPRLCLHVRASVSGSAHVKAMRYPFWGSPSQKAKGYHTIRRSRGVHVLILALSCCVGLPHGCPTLSLCNGRTSSRRACVHWTCSTWLVCKTTRPRSVSSSVAS